MTPQKINKLEIDIMYKQCYNNKNIQESKMEVLLTQALIIWIMINGLALITGAVFGDPLKNVKMLNLWLVNLVRKTIGGAIQMIADIIKPKKKGRRK